MSFKVGQKVVFVRDVGGGVIVEVSNFKIVIEDEHGFKHVCEADDLALVYNEDYTLDDKQEAQLLNSKEQKDLKKRSQKHKRFVDELWEIDLHIEKLMDNHRSLSNSQIIRRQMSALQTFINKAVRNNISKVVVIHGVGEGVLMNEVLSYLDKIDGVKYESADYLTYGKGATEVTFL